ncbi:MAG: hypothetical protein MZW92_14465 [Comamonadaceae bacterium]|nr:hypothetical protein [Comamonadaceae bacterium]
MVIFARHNVVADPPFTRMDAGQLPQRADLLRARGAGGGPAPAAVRAGPRRAPRPRAQRVARRTAPRLPAAAPATQGLPDAAPRPLGGDAGPARPQARPRRRDAPRRPPAAAAAAPGRRSRTGAADAGLRAAVGRRQRVAPAAARLRRQPPAAADSTRASATLDLMKLLPRDLVPVASLLLQWRWPARPSRSARRRCGTASTATAGGGCSLVARPLQADDDEGFAVLSLEALGEPARRRRFAEAPDARSTCIASRTLERDLALHARQPAGDHRGARDHQRGAAGDQRGADGLQRGTAEHQRGAAVGQRGALHGQLRVPGEGRRPELGQRRPRERLEGRRDPDGVR